MKKLISILLLIATLVPCMSAMTITSSAAVISSDARIPFEDVSEDAWYFDYAAFAYMNGIITGQGNDYTFAPNTNLNRATFVVMLARALPKSKFNYTIDLSLYGNAGYFKDCPKGTWYTPSVEWAYANGFVSGTGNGNFSPNKTMTREEAAVMFQRILAYLGKGEYETDESVYYNDMNKVSSWAKSGVKFAINTKIMSSTSTSKKVFSPKATMTRAQIATMFCNLLTNYAECVHRTRTEVSCTKGDWCRGCGIKFTLPEGHLCNQLSCVVGGKCKKCGEYIERDKNLHSYTAVSCTEDSKCTLCGNVRQEALGHNYTAVSCTKDSKCTRCGDVRSKALGHTTSFGICGRCNAEIFATPYLRLAYYMVAKTSGNGNGVYTLVSNGSGNGYTTTTRITYNANKTSFELFYRYRASNSSYIEYTITIPKVSSYYSATFNYISDAGTTVAKGSGMIEAKTTYCEFEYTYDQKNFTESKIEGDLAFTYELAFLSFNNELIKLCNSNITALGFGS